MQQGTIRLRSGPWDWRVSPQTSGASVVFQHRQRSRDEMRTWASEMEMNDSRAHELALDPVERTWVDADGLAWTIRVELPTDWARDHTGHEGGLRLEFSCGTTRKSFWVPGDTRLGELTHFELSRLLNEG